jgi:hypothetical protein
LAFVGGDRDSLLGAQACGLRTIGVHGHDDVAADAWLGRFSELWEVVERWSAWQVAA